MFRYYINSNAKVVMVSYLPKIRHSSKVNEFDAESSRTHLFVGQSNLLMSAVKRLLITINMFEMK